MADVFIYALCEPDTGAVRYVGITKDTKTRLQGHLADCNRPDVFRHPKVTWLRQLLASGQVPALRVLEQCPAEDGPQAEQKWIDRYRGEGAQLTNTAPGGKGYTFSYKQAPIPGIPLPHLRTWREHKRLGITVLSALADMPRNTLGSIERGQMLASREQIQKLAGALHISPKRLLRAPVKMGRPAKQEQEGSTNHAGSTGAPL